MQQIHRNTAPLAPPATPGSQSHHHFFPGCCIAPCLASCSCFVSLLHIGQHKVPTQLSRFKVRLLRSSCPTVWLPTLLTIKPRSALWSAERPRTCSCSAHISLRLSQGPSLSVPHTTHTPGTAGLWTMQCAL